MQFRKFFEMTDIFGFDAKRASEKSDDSMLSKPINMFNLELMMDILSRKSVGLFEAFVPFVNEIRWGYQPGAIKLEVDTGYTFYIKRLGIDLQGNPRWITKKMFQLNRQGYGGLEDSVAQEIHEHMLRTHESMLDGPKDFTNDDLENIVVHCFNKSKRIAKDIFIPVGIRKLGEYNYVIMFDIKGHGVESPGQSRVEQNQTMFSYDKEQGTIRMFNYNIESPVGKAHSWTLRESDLDIYFFPSQDREEISECLAVHYKYY